MIRIKTSTLWKKWKELSIKAASFQGRVILTLLFFSILLPVGLYFQTKKNKKLRSLWNNKDLRNTQTLEDLKRQ